MKENLDQVLDWIIEDEGGYTEKHGLGGATNRGITFTVFKEVWAKDKHFRDTFYPGVKTPTFKELKNLTVEGAKYIYQHHILPKVKFEELPSGLDYVMSNAATMEGPTGAIKILQEELDLPITGKWNESMFKAIEERDHAEVAAGVLLRQAYKKMHDKRIATYARGWSNRIVEIWGRAKELYK